MHMVGVCKDYTKYHHYNDTNIPSNNLSETTVAYFFLYPLGKELLRLFPFSNTGSIPLILAPPIENQKYRWHIREATCQRTGFKQVSKFPAEICTQSRSCLLDNQCYLEPGQAQCGLKDHDSQFVLEYKYSTHWNAPNHLWFIKILLILSKLILITTDVSSACVT